MIPISHWWNRVIVVGLAQIFIILLLAACQCWDQGEEGKPIITGDIPNPEDVACLEQPQPGYGVAYQEVSTTYINTWTKKRNTYQHGPIELPASSELELSLVEYDGKLDSLHLYYVTDSGNGEWHQIRFLTGDARPGETLWVSGHPDEPSYWWINCSGWVEEGQSGGYTIRVRSTARDDVGSGLDAGEDSDDMLNLTADRLGKTLEGYLFDTLTVGNRDEIDIYRIPYVKAGTTIQAQLLGVQFYPASSNGSRVIENVDGSGPINFDLRQARCDADGVRIEDPVGSWKGGQNSIGMWEHTAEQAGHYYLIISRQGSTMYSYSFRVNLIPPN